MESVRGDIMYLLYESLYGELVYENDTTEIVGLYDSREKAVETAKENIKKYVEEWGYVVDKESDNFEKSDCVIMFQNNQENWNCYFTICIKKVEVE